MTSDEPISTAKNGNRNSLSNLLAVAAVVFALIAVALYFRNPAGRSGVAPIPAAAPGSNQIVHVTEALKAQGLDVQQPPGRFIPRGALDVPGQGVEINDQSGFIFLYETADAADRDASGVDPVQIVPDRLAGTPAPAGERRMTWGSNVAVLMIGGDDATWQKVKTAVASLP